MKELTKQQEKVLSKIRAYAEGHGGQTPSLRRIADDMGFASPHAAFRHVEVLVTKGKLKKIKGENGFRGHLVLVPCEEKK